MPNLTWSPGAAGSLALDIIKGVLVAFVASWLAVRGAVRQFSSQRWWERQEEAYRKIVENLSRIQVLLSKIDNSGAEFHSQDDQIRTWQQVTKTIDDLKQTSHENAFRISKNSTEALRKLVSQWYPAPPVGQGPQENQMLDVYRALIAECLPVIDREARKDLRLRSQR